MGCPKLKENFTFLKALHSKKGESLKKNDLDYYSFGMPMPNRNIEGQYRYAYQGQEKDPETGMEAFELRLWDGRIGRWLTTDPYGQYFSPYLGMGNNPISRVDPDGGMDNPVYDENGNFLGTTASGLQGEAIIMNADDFTQGMSDASALGVGTLFSNFSGSENAMNSIQSHFSNLSNRPDWDGKLTFAEVTKWSNEGSGEPLFVDAGRINLNPINTGDFSNNSSRSIDFFSLEYFHPETGSVYGHIQVTLTNPNSGTVRLGNSETLLDIHDFVRGSTVSKINDYLYPGNPADFNIYCTPCTSRIRTTAEVKQYWNNIYKVMGKRPKF